jgi:hypothetical protein
MGKKSVDDRAISRMKQKLADADTKPLLKDLAYAPGWIGDIMRRLAEKS